MSGKKKYVPQIVIDEMDSLKDEQNILRDSEALKKMAEYSKRGRNIEKMFNKVRKKGDGLFF